MSPLFSAWPEKGADGYGYLGRKQGHLATVAPNHPFAHSQISFGTKPPASSSRASQPSSPGSMFEMSPENLEKMKEHLRSDFLSARHLSLRF